MDYLEQVKVAAFIDELKKIAAIKIVPDLGWNTFGRGSRLAKKVEKVVTPTPIKLGTAKPV